MEANENPLKALAFTCSLKPGDEPSSTDILAGQLLTELKQHNVTGESIRAVNHAILPGVSEDMGEGDAWPALRQKMLDADIMIMATPTWVGHMSSVAQRIIERLDAELSFADEQGRLKTYGKVAGAVIVGNEDGAHKITADLFQSLNDVGFTIPAATSVYWNGEAMHKTDYKDLDKTPEMVASSLKMAAANLAHAARLLRARQYPGVAS